MDDTQNPTNPPSDQPVTDPNAPASGGMGDQTPAGDQAPMGGGEPMGGSTPPAEGGDENQGGGQAPGSAV